MPELLIEFFSEEMPARMQARASADLERLLTEKLATAGFAPQSVQAFASPRHLGVVAQGVAAMSAPVREERKGPRVGAPEAAIQGFLKSAGLSSLEQAEVVEDKKGAFYQAVVERAGRRAQDAIGPIVVDIVRTFPWPKSMRWASGDLRWVRPLHSIVCLYDGAVVPIDIDAIVASDKTVGHRFHSPTAFSVTSFADYRAKLAKARVLIDAAERKEKIFQDARAACSVRGLALVEDSGLLEEVAGLVEWPVVVFGDMDAAFLDLPGEVIRLTMRTHQKYFAVRDPKTQNLAPHFVTVANIEAADGGAAIAAGNARVLSARLNDARYFWDLDRRTKLEQRIAKLDRIVFHQKLGTLGDKVRRIEGLAGQIAPQVGADVSTAKRAARLAKADLVTETVGEFPELQGQIGRQLAELEGLDASVAIAIEDHYRPLGPSDRVPTDPVAIAVALADKIDTLTGFWAIDEKPTGSSDPYALRRAALGVVRIVLDRRARIALAHPTTPAPNSGDHGVLGSAMRAQAETHQGQLAVGLPALLSEKVASLLAFILDRLRVQLREQGKRHDHIDAVLALEDDDLVRLVAKVEALERFLATPDGANLVAGYKRAANILRAEEKKEAGLAERLADAEIVEALVTAPAERDLHRALNAAASACAIALAQEDYQAAMGALAGLRAPVDRFFTEVMVNDADLHVRLNRLALLATLRRVLHQAADFSKLEG